MASTYENILETSYRLFAEHGFEKTSMAMIAKALNISKPALYYHFESKDAIIDTLFEELCRSIAFLRFFKLQDYTRANFAEKLTSDGLHLIGSQQEDAHYSQIMKQYQALGYRNAKYAERLLEILEGFTAGFAELLQHGAALGAIPGDDVLVRAQMLNMILDSIDNYINYGFKYDYNAIWIKAVADIVKGVDHA